MNKVKRVLIAAITFGMAELALAGEFQGKLEFKPADCEKKLWCELKYNFGYVDSTGTGWQTNAGDKTDGASIPEWAQPHVGGQFENEFIRAAVIHDHYCNRHVRPWRDTHRVFYDALLASQVPKPKALLMYYAVYLGGPKWVELIQGRPCPVGDRCIERATAFTKPVDTERKTSEQGRIFLTRSSRYSDPTFQGRIKETEKLIAERGGNISLEDLEARAKSVRPEDFFYVNQDAIADPTANSDR
jgi:Protein of unknown function (DUF1353)